MNQSCRGRHELIRIRVVEADSELIKCSLIRIRFVEAGGVYVFLSCKSGE